MFVHLFPFINICSNQAEISGSHKNIVCLTVYKFGSKADSSGREDPGPLHKPQCTWLVAYKLITMSLDPWETVGSRS